MFNVFGKGLGSNDGRRGKGKSIAEETKILEN